MKKLIISAIIIMVTGVGVWAENNGEGLSFPINPDNRGIDYSVYENETRNEKFLENYTKKKGGWCSDDHEMKVYIKRKNEIDQEKEKNESLLTSIYDVNPDAFNQLAKINKRIEEISDFKQESDSLNKQIVENLKKFQLNSDPKNAEKNLEKINYYLNRRHYFFPDEKINTYSPEKKELAQKFNQIEGKICEVYQNIPHNEFDSYFTIAFEKAIHEKKKTDADLALKNMAVNIKTIKVGVDNSDVVTNLLGVPISRIHQDGIDTIKYQYALNNDKGFQSVRIAIVEIQCGSTGIVNFISVTKTGSQYGSVDEIYKVGERHVPSPP
jgi:TolA-binding protein